MAREIKIKVIVKHCKTKDGKKEFDAYRAVQADGKLIDCRFQAHIQNIPKENFVMLVRSDEINISKAYEYPRLWVANVLEFMSVPTAKTEGEDGEAGEQLPF